MKILLLLCALGMPRAECQPDTAVDVIQGPPVKNEVQCGLIGQAVLARTSLTRPDVYLKIVCVRGT